MSLWPLSRKGRIIAVLAGAGLCAGGGYAAWVAHGGMTAGPVQNGELGFVLTNLAYVEGPDAAVAGSCPDGMSKDVIQIFQTTPAGARRPGESDQDYSDRLEDNRDVFATGPDGRNYCAFPAAAPRDSHFRTMDRANIRLAGIDLDGEHSARTDFVAPDGTRGVDNQFFRATGCSRSYQPAGLSINFGQTMLTGEWGVLISLSDVDDLANDSSVKVGFYANADPISLSPTRTPLPYATYALDQDPRFRAETGGRIVDGVLTTDPVDFRFRGVTNSMHVERVLRDARVRATVTAEGAMNGYLAGFAPIDALYENQFGFNKALTGAGQPAPAPLIKNTANGAARVLGFTCHGMYQAFNRLADAYPDPETGRNTAISIQYTFSAINAFLVDVDTSSENDALVGNAGQRP